MKKRTYLIAIALIATVLNFYLSRTQNSQEIVTSGKIDYSSLRQAINARKSDVQVKVTAKVARVLSDDLKGSRHQRFLIKLPNNQTVLIAHNIDLAPKVAGIKSGDMVSVYGEYEWNEKGGVIHWTHHDPANRHIGGWISHKGRTYQ